MKKHLSVFNSSRLFAAFLWLTATASLLQAEELHYLVSGQTDSATILAPPPLPGSAEEAADMASVVAIHNACGKNEAALAFSEKKFSIFNFSPAVGAVLTPGKLPKTEAFFERVKKEAAVVTDLGKEHWKRPRPFTTNPSLASGKLEKSFSYPSGHSTEATVLALLLAELFPDKSEGILAIGRDIGWHRVWIARHYPTDIYAGRVFAKAIVREMKTNPEFRHDFLEVKTEIATAQQTNKASTEVSLPAAAHALP